MKRAGPGADQADPSSSDSSSSDSEDEAPYAKKNLVDKAEAGKKRRGVLDYGALSRHGYRGGLSVLRVPPPKAADEGKPDWSWAAANAAAVAVSHGGGGAAAATGGGGREKGGKSFSQKEKRKRDFGQASRGKNYVEEEKRLLRDSGVYSGFDS
ncbi:unnamed protein product [Spirodela intermedia]|uniref:Uncharacterized protein n=1 Tax=Spirodela intermedia TaxID=51605 RepID=A0A7I8JAF7_SPIIN|nr:unnamed protein product [Spirodela intermedia]CAA6667198.1 unnamed protein product [Spirodela intermedia]